MNQSTTFILVMTGIMLLFWVMGVLPENATANSTILTTLTNPSNLQNNGVILTILLYVGTALGGVVLGFFVKNYELIIKIPIGTYLIGLLWDFGLVYLKIVQSGVLIGIIALLFFGPLMFMWFLTMVDYIFGRD